jgi:hypothetical protein
MDLVVVFFVICAIAWLRKGWVLPSRLARRPGYLAAPDRG